MDNSVSNDIRFMYLEDQVNRMNLVILRQGQQIDELKQIIKLLKGKIKNLENIILDESEESGGIGDAPPDGINR